MPWWLLSIGLVSRPAALERRSQRDRKSSSIKYRLGTKNSVMAVANSTPNASEMAIGINIKVSGSSLVMRGMSPTKVVTEVKIMGLKRATPAWVTASNNGVPAAL